MKYIFFDLDGTLTDPAVGITTSVKYALDKMGRPTGDISEYNRFIGPPLRNSFREWYGMSAEEAEQAVSYYREYFSPTGIFQNRVYDGIPEALSRLIGDGYGIGLNLWGALITEVILTFVFIYTILGVTSDKNKSHIAGIVIGLTLTFVHIIGINLTGTSVNPARSLAPAILLGGTAVSQVWVFIVAPFLGSALAAFTYDALNVDTTKVTKISTTKKK